MIEEEVLIDKGKTVWIEGSKVIGHEPAYKQKLQ